MIDSVNKAISILNCFTIENSIQSVAEISRTLGYNKSTTSRILSTLAERGCVERMKRRGEYRLGYRIYLWNLILEKHSSLPAIARPIMEKLRDSCKEEISLYVVEGEKRICVERFDSLYGIGKIGIVGSQLPLHAGASGRLLLAYLAEKKRNRIISKAKLKKFTSKTIVDPNTLKEALSEIRRNGYAISKGEREDDAFSVTAPIWNSKKQVIASLNISGPLFRFTEDKAKSHLKSVLDAAKEISKRIGGTM